jgi:hypothetical protein
MEYSLISLSLDCNECVSEDFIGLLGHQTSTYANYMLSTTISSISSLLIQLPYIILGEQKAHYVIVC